ncbi:HIRAN domain-containing protein [Pseudoroseicyclus sp. H15]
MIWIWLAFGVVTAIAASSRGRSFWGWLLIGCVTGVFGLVAVLVIKDVSGSRAALHAPSPKPQVSKYAARAGRAEPSAQVGTRRRVLRVRGDGHYLQEVVGESQYCASIRRAVGDPGGDGVDVRKTVTLEHQPHNAHDKNAVAVRLEGSIVGYLPRDDAAEWVEAQRAQALSAIQVTASARIRGGWERPGDDHGHFGVRIDAAYPFEFYEA